MMYKAVAIVGVIGAVLSSPVSAQVIHEHPQKAAYGSAAEYPPVSTQAHFTPSGAPVPIGSMASQHVHVEPQCPIYAETAGEPLNCKFVIKHANLDGFGADFYGEAIRNVVWDDTGTATPPVMPGSVMAHLAGLGNLLMSTLMSVQTYTGSLVIDPKIVGPNWTAFKRGWFQTRISHRVYFHSGARVDVEQWIPLYSVQDRTAPEIPQRGGGHGIMESQIDVVNNAGVASRLGTNVVEYLDKVPIAPISADWHVPVSFYSYSGDPSLSHASLEQRVNMDFHTGVLGTVLMHVDDFSPQPSAFIKDVVFSPAAMGAAGPHRMMQNWTQLDPVSHEQITAISVLNITTLGGGPALCTDPTATNIGQPLPCTYAAPEWVTLSGLFQTLGGLFRFCPTPATCQEYLKK